MWEISDGIIFVLLLRLAIIDYAWHKVPKAMLASMGISSILLQCFGEMADWHLLAGGAGIGLLFLFISKVTREEIGYGDSWGIFFLGIYLGLWKVLEVLAVTFVILFIWSVVIWCAGKRGRQQEIPFYPLLSIGYFVVLTGSG